MKEPRGFTLARCTSSWEELNICSGGGPGRRAGGKSLHSRNPSARSRTLPTEWLPPPSCTRRCSRRMKATWQRLAPSLRSRCRLRARPPFSCACASRAALLEGDFTASHPCDSPAAWGARGARGNGRRDARCNGDSASETPPPPPLNAGMRASTPARRLASSRATPT